MLVPWIFLLLLILDEDEQALGLALIGSPEELHSGLTTRDKSALIFSVDLDDSSTIQSLGAGRTGHAAETPALSQVAGSVDWPSGGDLW